MFVVKAERCRGGQQLSFGQSFYLGKKKNKNLEVSQVLAFKQDKEFNGGEGESVKASIFILVNLELYSVEPNLKIKMLWHRAVTSSGIRVPIAFAPLYQDLFLPARDAGLGHRGSLRGC